MKKLTIKIIFILIVSISGLLIIGRLTNGHDWGADFASYIMQAKSITEGSPRAFIESNRFTIEQSSGPMGPIAYPWGYSVLLAPIYALFGLNLLALKSVAVICFLLFLMVFWFVFRKNHSPSWFLLLVSLFAFNPNMLEFTNSIMADLPFLLVSTIGIWIIQEIVVQDRQIFSPLTDLIFIGIVITIAFLLRTNGVLLLVTLGLSQAISAHQKKSGKQKSLLSYGANSNQERMAYPKRISIKHLIVKFTPYIIFFCSVTIWRLFLPEGGNSHISFLKNVSAEWIKTNLFHYLEVSFDFFHGVPFPYLIIGASIPLAVAGALRRFRSEYTTIIYIMLTLLLYIIWPYKAGIRFLFPIFPFYVSFAFSSLEAFGDGTNQIDKAIRKVLSYLPIIIIILLFLKTNLLVVNNRLTRDGAITSGPFSLLSQDMFSYIENHTKPDSIIVFGKPRLMSLLTGRQSIRLINADQLSRGDYLSFYPRGDYLRSTQVSEPEIARLLEQGTVQIVYKNDEFVVYRLTKE